MATKTKEMAAKMHQRLMARIEAEAPSGSLVAMAEDDDDDDDKVIIDSANFATEDELRNWAKMEGGLPSLQSSAGPESGQPHGGRPRPFAAKYDEMTETPRTIHGEAPGGVLEPGGHVSATRPAGTEPVSPKMSATPGQLAAALHFERDRGKGDLREKAGKVENHLTERPSYYVELERMMDPDNAPVIRRSVTPGDLVKAKDGGWSQGPKGGTRRKLPNGSWEYKGQASGDGGAGKKTKSPAIELKHPEGGAPPKSSKEKPKGSAKPGIKLKHPEGGEPGPGGPGALEEEIEVHPRDEREPHPDALHDGHQTTDGKDLAGAIKHLDSIDPHDLKQRGEAIAEEVGRKDPEAGNRIKEAMVHLEHATRRGAAKRKAGKSTKKEDMDTAQALKSILKDFNAAAAPASILGPELGGILKPDHDNDPQHADASAQAAKKEARKTKGKGQPTKPTEAEKALVIPVGRLLQKSGPYGPGSWGPVPTIAPIAGSSPREETPAIPDFQEIFYQPETDERKKLEDDQRLTRRLATAKRNSGVYGFHGTGLPRDEPILHYVPTDGGHTGPRLSARKPLFSMDKDLRRRESGTPAGPEKGGAPVDAKTDRGRVPRSSDRRDDPVLTVGGRVTPRDHADDEKKKREAKAVVAKMGKLFGLSTESESRILSAFMDSLEKGASIEDLWKAARGGKYLKRVPYFKDGKKKYRYYYSESSIAREAQVGEEVRLGKKKLTVEELHEDGSLTILMGKKKRKLSREQYAQLLSRHYGYRYYEFAEKRAKQAMNAVFRHVPKGALVDLKGDTFEERLEDLRKRLPGVHAKLEASFQRAGVSPRTARYILTKTLERRGWTPDARAAAIGSVLTEQTNAKSFHEILRGAENLAGGAIVESKHVGAVVELRGHDGPGEASFADKVARVAAQAEKDLAKLKSLLAQGDPGADMGAVAAALTSTAMAKLQLLTQAFPGLQDRVAADVRETLLEVPSRIPGPPKTEGAETVVFVSGENGEPRALKARYVLMEADDVIASHDPTKGFKKRDDYPEDVQERAYHRDKAEQAKVIRQAMRLKPEFVVNTNPDAVNGPPMVTKKGHALGGNSRAMSMQKAYADHPEKADELRAYLEEHAHAVGFTGDDIRAMKKPILVRVIDDPTEDGPSLFGGEAGTRAHTKEEMQLLVRQMNESFTQAMDPRTMQVAMGRKLDDAALMALADGMEDGETLAQFLTSKRSESFVNALMRTGIIDQRNRNQYVTKATARLNADGRTLVSRILVGRLVGNADILSETRPSTVESVARATPHMMAAKSHGEGYDLSTDMGIALEALNDLQKQAATGKAHFGASLDPKMDDAQFEGLFSQQGLFGDAPEVTNNPRAMSLLKVLIKKPGPQQLASVFKAYAQEAAKHPEGQSGLFGAPPTPQEVLESALKASGISASPKKKEVDAAIKTGDTPPMTNPTSPEKAVKQAIEADYTISISEMSDAEVVAASAATKKQLQPGLAEGQVAGLTHEEVAAQPELARRYSALQSATIERQAAARKPVRSSDEIAREAAQAAIRSGTASPSQETTATTPATTANRAIQHAAVKALNDLGVTAVGKRYDAIVDGKLVDALGKITVTLEDADHGNVVIRTVAFADIAALDPHALVSEMRTEIQKRAKGTRTRRRGWDAPS